MNNTLALIRLELKARYGLSGVTRKSVILKYVLGVVFFGLIYALFLFGLYTIVSMFHVYEMDYHFLLLYVLLFAIVMVAVGVSTTIKNLYHSGDNELMLRFPVTGRTMYIAKMVTQTISSVAMVLLGFLPVLIMFGVTINANALYWGMTPFALAFMVAIPMALSNLLAIPVMAVNAKVSHFHLANLVVSVALVAGGFALYMVIFESVVGFLRDQSAAVFSQDGLQWLVALRHVYPVSCIADILLGKRLALAWPLLLGSSAICIAGSLLVTAKFYLTTVLRHIEAGGASFEHRTVNRCRSAVGSIFRREFLDIFRSNNYSFQYLVMACAAPVMVYSCNRLAQFVGSQTLDLVTLPALTLLVLFIFITITVSFAGSCVSREGEAFYLTKINPVPAYYQVLVKATLYIIVAVASIVVSMVVVMATKQMYVSYSFGIMGIGILYAVGLTAFAVKLDMTRPQFPVGGDGELANGNFATFVTLFVGMAISVLMGLFGLVGSALWNPPFTFGMIGVMVFVLAAAAVCWLLIRVRKAYDKIVQR